MKSATVAKSEPQLLWNYASIEDEAPVEVIQQAAEQIKVVFRRTLGNIVEIGKLLHVVRENMPHGSWGDWLTVELKLSASSACNYLRAYEHRDEFKAVENWTAGAAFLLTGPGAPDDAIEQANQIAESGETVTKQDARDILDGEKPPMTQPDRDPAEETSGDLNAPSEVNHDQARTRQATERGGSQDNGRLEMKYAAALWSAAAKLAELNAGGCSVVLTEAQKEAQQFSELSLGNDGRPCRDTLKSFLDGGRST
jgi:hypothetical protein